jgi:hypothetical protein
LTITERISMHRRSSVVLVAALAAATLTASPAWARPTFEQKSVPKGSLEKRLELQVPPEKAKTVNSHIEIFLPEGFEPRECTASVGWSCSILKRDPNNRRQPQVAFSRAGCTAESSWRCVHTEGEDEEKAGKSALQPVRISGRRPHLSDSDEKPGREEEEEDEGGTDFVFEVDIPAKAGEYPIPVIQYRTDPVNSEKIEWKGPAGSEHPAPVLTVQ